MGVHMTTEDHEQIWVLVEAGESYTDIVKAIGRHLTTFSHIAADTKFSCSATSPALRVGVMCWPPGRSDPPTLDG